MTDPGKTSKKGRLTLVKDSQGTMRTVRLEEVNGMEDIMVTVFRWHPPPLIFKLNFDHQLSRNGELVRDWTWEEVCNKQN